MKRIICWFLDHAWPWRELMDPDRVYLLAKGSMADLCIAMKADFFCKRCGASWKQTGGL